MDPARLLVGVIGWLLAVFHSLGSDLKNEIRASEARQEKQMNQLGKKFKASEARREKQMGKLKKANESLEGKMDPLPDAVSASKA